MHVTARRLLQGLLFVVPFALDALPVSRAIADETDTKATCKSAYEQGQRLRKSGALRKSRTNLLVCARDPCPAAFQPECVQWLAEVEKLLPSVVVEAVGADGAPQSNVRVLIDGEVLAERLDGKSLEVDPGVHVFRFEPEGKKAIEQKLLIVEGEKSRKLHIEIEPKGTPVEAPKPEEPKKSSVVPWVLGGVGVLALGSFAYFGATGLSKRGELDDCTPYCKQDDIDSVRRKFLIADVSLGVGVVALGVATFMLVSSPSTEPKKDATVHVDGGPIAGGGKVALTITF